jgi:hypothetical protein
MNTSLRAALVITGIIVLAAILLLTGLWIGRMGWGMSGFWPGGLMSTNTSNRTGMMQNDIMGGGTMMNQGMMNGGSMMGGGIMNGNAMMNGGTMMGSGMMGTGMMGNGGLYANATPLSLEAAQQALDQFLQSYKNEDLAVGEIMIFDNHAYAEIVEQSTGIGAMEMLVGPVTLAVAPEHGPNMMWNLKYGAMAGYGGGMMGIYGNTPSQPAEISSEMPVTLEQAVESAQRYLDTYLPGTQADEQADPFYGYYTLHVLRDGKVIGMISVNGYTGQVFLHTWHGDFVEMSGE